MIQRLPANVATALVAALLLAPSLLIGTLPSHSSPHNVSWASQFAEQFQVGILYPRWMPDSFDGLGGPAFYFYPPLVFWIDGLLEVVTLGALGVSRRLAIVALLLLWGSGWAMYRWLRAQPLDHRAALLGALAYEAAPYHLTDHYIRGAIAEFAAYTMLPLIMLALQRTAASARRGPVLLAVAYAALLLAHLPTALLISTVAIPAYVFFLAWPFGRASWPFLLRAAAAGLLGLGIAAIYLLPALSLQDAISSEQLWTEIYNPRRWLLTAQDWRDPEATITLVLLASLSCAALAVAALALRPRLNDTTFWALLCLAGVALVTGVVPWFWTSVPLMSKVQFPYRLLLVVEFAAATLLGIAPWRERRLATRLCSILAIGIGTIALGLLVFGVHLRVEAALHEEVEAPHDAKEYLPAGYPQRVLAAYDDLSLDLVKDLPLISCQPAASACVATPGRFGELAIEIESPVPTTVTVRRFFFPSWRLEPASVLAPVLAPTAPLRLVSFVAPAGHTALRLYRVSLPVEHWAWAISAVSGVLLLAFAAAESRIAGARGGGLKPQEEWRKQ